MRGVGIMALSASRREVRFGGPSVWQFFFSLKKEHRRAATAQITLIFSFNLKLGENPLLPGVGGATIQKTSQAPAMARSRLSWPSWGGGSASRVGVVTCTQSRQRAPRADTAARNGKPPVGNERQLPFGELSPRKSCSMVAKQRRWDGPGESVANTCQWKWIVMVESWRFLA